MGFLVVNIYEHTMFAHTNADEHMTVSKCKCMTAFSCINIILGVGLGVGARESAHVLATGCHRGRPCKGLFL